MWLEHIGSNGEKASLFCGPLRVSSQFAHELTNFSRKFCLRLERSTGVTPGSTVRLTRLSVRRQPRPARRYGPGKFPASRLGPALHGKCTGGRPGLPHCLPH
eukprot:38181-Hanusia_phi.AAC.1